MADRATPPLASSDASFLHLPGSERRPARLVVSGPPEVPADHAADLDPPHQARQATGALDAGAGANAATEAGVPAGWSPPGASSPRPQAMLFTLWGDYVVHRGGEIWTGSLIRIAAEFGLSELAVRSVLMRMTRSGWLEATRKGNRSYYRLTRHGRAIIEEGTRRIFRPRRAPWDGQWHVVAYSIPEARRALRDRFRKRLSYLGFGPLSAGAWITPHDLRSEVEELAADLGLGGCVEQFRGAYLAAGEERALAARVWPLARLAAAYRAFLERWRPVAHEVEAGLPDARAFVLRFWLIHEYQRFFLEDPDLPPALVPPAWPGGAASQQFERLHACLAPGANRFFDAVYESSPAVARRKGGSAWR